MLKAAIIGYGKMGKEVEKVLLETGMTVSVIINDENEWEDAFPAFLESDIAIEFTSPENTLKNFERCFKHRIPLISGTTGWNAKENEVINRCRQENLSFIYSSNFSIGANLFFKINEQFAKLINHHPQYAVSIEETHHINKKDAPSGTAITTEQSILKELKNARSIPVVSHRVGDITGEHTVFYTSPDDTIAITHTAKNRSIFAQGAVKAAAWLVENPGVYHFSDIVIHLKN